MGAGLGQIRVFVAVDFLVLERLHEQLALGVVVGVAAPAHADLDAVGFEQIGIISRCILHTAVGVMHQAGNGFPCSQRHLPGLDRQRRLQRTAQRPSDDFARECIQDDRQIHKL